MRSPFFIPQPEGKVKVLFTSHPFHVIGLLDFPENWIPKEFVVATPAEAVDMGYHDLIVAGRMLSRYELSADMTVLELRTFFDLWVQDSNAGAFLASARVALNAVPDFIPPAAYTADTMLKLTRFGVLLDGLGAGTPATAAEDPAATEELRVLSRWVLDILGAQKMSLDGTVPPPAEILATLDVVAQQKAHLMFLNSLLPKKDYSRWIDDFSAPEGEVKDWIDASAELAAEWVKPAPMFLWLIYGGEKGLDEFLTYYGRICPAGTKAIVMFDYGFTDLDAVKDKFSGKFDCLFLDVPMNKTYYISNLQYILFSRIYPKPVGLGTWNLFVDIDEFIPLPKDVPDLAALCSLMDARGLTQLPSMMLDVWELIPAPGADATQYIPRTPSDVTAPTAVPPPLNDLECFVDGAGRSNMVWGSVRAKAMGLPGDLVSKFVLVKADENSFYTYAAHVPHGAYKSWAEATLRYPLIHKRFMRTRQESDTLFVARDVDYEATRINSFFGRRQQWLRENALANPNGGYGPWAVLGPGDDSKFLADFADSLVKRSDFFADDLTFDVTTLASFYPFLNLGPLG